MKFVVRHQLCVTRHIRELLRAPSGLEGILGALELCAGSFASKAESRMFMYEVGVLRSKVSGLRAEVLRFQVRGARFGV